MRPLRALILLCACGCSDVTYSIDDPWPDPTSYPEIGDGKVIVTNSGDDTLSWLDLETLEPVFRSPVGRVPPEREGPHHGAALADGSAYFIGISNVVPAGGSGPHGSHGTGTVPGYLLKYDGATHRLVGEVLVDRSPGDVRLTPDERYVLQSHFDLLRITEVLSQGGDPETMNSALAIVDPIRMERVALVSVCPAAHGIAIAADSSEAYITCWATDELARVTLTPPFPVVRFPIAGTPTPPPAPPIHEPYSAAVNPADGKVWVSCLKTGEIRIFDPAAGAWESEAISVGPAPFFGDFTDDGRFLVPRQGANQLAVVDVATKSVLEQVALPESCQKPHAVLVLPTGRAGIVCEGNHVDPGTVLRVALDGTLRVEAAYEVGVFPDDLVLIRKTP